MLNREVRWSDWFLAKIKQANITSFVDEFREIIGDSFQDASRRKVKKWISDRLTD